MCVCLFACVFVCAFVSLCACVYVLVFGILNIFIIIIIKWLYFAVSKLAFIINPLHVSGGWKSLEIWIYAMTVEKKCT